MIVISFDVGIKNLAYCIIDCDIITMWDKLDITADNIKDIGLSMYRQLNAIPALLTADRILIENQPSFINPKMKTVSIMLFSYFLHTLPTKEILLCSPSRKLIVKGNDLNKNLSYTQKKKLSIEITRNIIKDQPAALLMLNKYKKIDDLCDAYLQSVNHK